MPDQLSARPRVTVAAIVERAGLFLLVEEQTQDGLRLNQPAGHLEAGESPQQGVVRETWEETGRSFKPSGLVGIYLSRTRRGDQDVSYLRLAFYGEVSEADARHALDEGIVRTLWMDVDAIRASADRHRSPLVLRCVEDYLSGKRYPLQLIATDPSVYG
ncbi:NUDIX hydrolase [Thiomonas bhubaneswarensis]|uniref:Phosphatase NudJ n=1 Tax=Thiomonas bhubaneswarensis TaxID=339866 RepID=A0A0K6HVB1_9BURK|nr:NUDIX hydrolase [Thiomonas bhubaneswarensis]CUA94835.1 ADP-ribose pyrophosphatase YjhB, NUDIX family [Thiomonas bhubaneswarensis]